MKAAGEVFYNSSGLYDFFLFYTPSVSCSVGRHSSVVWVVSHNGETEKTVSFYRKNYILMALDK